MARAGVVGRALAGDRCRHLGEVLKTDAECALGGLAVQHGDSHGYGDRVGHAAPVTGLDVLPNRFQASDVLRGLVDGYGGGALAAMAISDWPGAFDHGQWNRLSAGALGFMEQSEKTLATQPVKAGREGECETSDKGWTDLGRDQLTAPLA